MKVVTTHEKKPKIERKKTYISLKKKKKKNKLASGKKNYPHTGESTLKKNTSFQLTNSSSEDKNLSALLPDVRALC